MINCLDLSFADPNKERVYLWSAYSELLHNKVLLQLGFSNNSSKVLFGQAVLDSGRLYIMIDELIVEDHKEKIKSGEYDWLSDYKFDIEFTKGEL